MSDDEGAGLERTAREASAALAERRAAARAASLNAIAVLTQAMCQTLGGETLKGAPNLVRGGESPRPYCGYRVRAAAGRWDAPLEWPRGTEPFDEDGRQWGPESLVVDIHGRLRVSRLSGLGDVWVREVREDELVAEDAEKLANVLGVALHQHVGRCERGEARYESIKRFSDALAKWLGEQSSRSTALRGQEP